MFTKKSHNTPFFYQISNGFFEWADENYQSQKPIITALLFTATHIANKLMWPEHFGLPRDYAMHLMGISSRSQYYKAFDALVSAGFFVVIEKSVNQSKATIIQLSVPSDYTSRKTGGNTVAVTTDVASESTLNKKLTNFINIKKNKEQLYNLFCKNNELQEVLSAQGINAEKKAKEFISSVLATKQNVWRDESEFFLHMKNWALKQNEKSQNEQIHIKSALRDD